MHLQMPLVVEDTIRLRATQALCGGTTTVIDFVTPEQSMRTLAQRRQEADGVVAADYACMGLCLRGMRQIRRARYSSSRGGLPDVQDVPAYAGWRWTTPRLSAMTAVAGRAGVSAAQQTGPLLEELRRRALRRDRVWHAALTGAAGVSHPSPQRYGFGGPPLYVFHVGAKSPSAVWRKTARRRHPRETCPQYLLLSAGRHLGGPDGELSVRASAAQ